MIGPAVFQSAAAQVRVPGVDFCERSDFGGDRAVEQVAAEIKRLDPAGKKMAAVVRTTFDVIYCGADTGRYRFDQLMKTEKTHFGTMFEINVQRAFGFPGGDRTDYRIAGHEVDAKWSMKQGGWMLPPEVFGEIAMVATGDDRDARFSVGLVRVCEDYRRTSVNRDAKTSLNQVGRAAIRWVWKDAPFSPNVLLQLAPEVVTEVLSHRHGTSRTNALFRAAEGMIVHRNAVRTVAQQLDDQKRVRANGGARSVLAAEGILILSGRYADLAQALGVPRPGPAEYVSVRVVPTAAGTGVRIGADTWRRAKPGELIHCPAPDLPRVGSEAPSPAGGPDADLWSVAPTW